MARAPKAAVVHENDKPVNSKPVNSKPVNSKPVNEKPVPVAEPKPAAPVRRKGRKTPRA